LRLSPGLTVYVLPGGGAVDELPPLTSEKSGVPSLGPEVPGLTSEKLGLSGLVIGPPRWKCTVQRPAQLEGGQKACLIRGGSAQSVAQCASNSAVDFRCRNCSRVTRETQPSTPSEKLNSSQRR